MQTIESIWSRYYPILQREELGTISLDSLSLALSLPRDYTLTATEQPELECWHKSPTRPSQGKCNGLLLSSPFNLQFKPTRSN